MINFLLDTLCNSLFESLPRKVQIGCAVLVLLGFVAVFAWLLFAQ